MPEGALGTIEAALCERVDAFRGSVVLGHRPHADVGDGHPVRNPLVAPTAVHENERRHFHPPRSRRRNRPITVVPDRREPSNTVVRRWTTATSQPPHRTGVFDDASSAQERRTGAYRSGSLPAPS